MFLLKLLFSFLINVHISFMNFIKYTLDVLLFLVDLTH